MNIDPACLLAVIAASFGSGTLVGYLHAALPHTSRRHR